MMIISLLVSNIGEFAFSTLAAILVNPSPPIIRRVNMTGITLKDADVHHWSKFGVFSIVHVYILSMCSFIQVIGQTLVAWLCREINTSSSKHLYASDGRTMHRVGAVTQVDVFPTTSFVEVLVDFGEGRGWFCIFTINNSQCGDRHFVFNNGLLTSNYG